MREGGQIGYYVAAEIVRRGLRKQQGVPKTKGEGGPELMKVKGAASRMAEARGPSRR